MNLDNRRLIEIRQEKKLYMNLLSNAESISECLLYKGRLDVLCNEERDILSRSGVEL